MKNKGFTLIELTAVVVLLGLLAALVAGPINKIIKDSRRTLDDNQKNQLVLATENWGADNPYLLPPFTENKTETTVTLGQLKSAGYLDTEIVNMLDKNKIPTCSYIKITLNPNALDGNKNTYKYEFVEEESCN